MTATTVHGWGDETLEALVDIIAETPLRPLSDPARHHDLLLALHGAVVVGTDVVPGHGDPRSRALALLPWLLAALGNSYAPPIVAGLDAITCGDDWPADAPDGFDWLMCAAKLATWDEPGVVVWNAGVVERLREIGATS